MWQHYLMVLKSMLIPVEIYTLQQQIVDLMVTNLGRMYRLSIDMEIVVEEQVC